MTLALRFDMTYDMIMNMKFEKMKFNIELSVVAFVFGSLLVF